MKTRIIIHATGTPSDMKVTTDDIENMNSQSRYTDPMPYHYIVNIDGTILKGRRDKELCGHCGKFSRDSLSVAYAGGINTDTGQPENTLNADQSKALRFIVEQLRQRYPTATVIGANKLLHPDEPMEDNEPFFDVASWYNLD